MAISGQNSRPPPGCSSCPLTLVGGKFPYARDLDRGHDLRCRSNERWGAIPGSGSALTGRSKSRTLACGAAASGGRLMGGSPDAKLSGLAERHARGPAKSNSGATARASQAWLGISQRQNLDAQPYSGRAAARCAGSDEPCRERSSAAPPRLGVARWTRTPSWPCPRPSSDRRLDTCRHGRSVGGGAGRGGARRSRRPDCTGRAFLSRTFRPGSPAPSVPPRSDVVHALAAPPGRAGAAAQPPAREPMVAGGERAPAA